MVTPLYEAYPLYTSFTGMYLYNKLIYDVLPDSLRTLSKIPYLRYDM